MKTKLITRTYAHQVFNAYKDWLKYHPEVIVIATTGMCESDGEYLIITYKVKE
jgi:hypothetical protein